MGFPMTVERVVNRNRLDTTNHNLMDDLRRLAEDSATLALRAEARPPEGLDPDALRKAIVLHDHRGNGGLAIRADHLSFHFTSECAALIAAEYARLSAGGATKP